MNGKNYHWKGHNELVEDDTETVIAKFHPKWLEGPDHKIGTLELNQKEIQDIIVVTAVVVQERSDEHKLSVPTACVRVVNWQVERARKRAMEIGIAGF